MRCVPPLSTVRDRCALCDDAPLLDVSLGAVVVKYIATESGGIHALELPDPVVAYLTMSDVEPGTLIQA